MVIRLLSTVSLEFIEIEGEEIPEYAILSHTWVTGQEITYQEMLGCLRDARHPSRSKSGFEKIQSACLKAELHGLAYAWVDTCCIDKKDPTELGEAINSMFKWYQQASICFVYLEDLVGGNEQLKGCRWFTRGWCLQELVAPKELKFYNQRWKVVGRKIELCEPLSQITGIDIKVLRLEESLDIIPVARRMSWAARRKTTRAEDTAYCLLGIFDIHMPLLYGEGGAGAFTRLQEEIIKRWDDLSIFAPLSYPFTHGESMIGPCDLFAPSPREFAGCGKVTRSPPRNFSNIACPFTMTNIGLHFPFQAMRAVLDWENPLYLLRLDCQGGRNSAEYLHLYLQKIAPSKFVPVRISSELFMRKVQGQLENLHITREPLFIVPNYTLALRSFFVGPPKQLVRFTANGKITAGFRPVYGRDKPFWDDSRASLFIKRCPTLMVRFELRRLSWLYAPVDYIYIYIYIGMTTGSTVYTLIPKSVELHVTKAMSDDLFDEYIEFVIDERSGTFATLMLGPNLITASLSRIDDSNYMVDIGGRGPL